MNNDTLFNRIKTAVANFSQQMPVSKRPQVEPEPEPTKEELAIGYVQKAEMVSAITSAAAHRRLLYIRYNTMWRHIEPYEFESGKKGLMVWAWCLVDGDIHSFYLVKMQEMYFTDIPFIPRFPIKI